MNHSEIKEQLLPAGVVGKMLSLSKRQIFRLKSSGKIPAVVRIGGSVRWKQTDIQKWIGLGCPDRKTFETIMGELAC
jgi:predicted DNA-binding transcriptional regulator AlpA